MRLLFVLFLSACSQGLDTPIEQVSCSIFTDEPSCVAAGCVLATSCGGPDEPAFPGCTDKTATTPDFCSDGCGMAEPACGSLTSADACDARSDCYTLLTFDEACNSEGCESHFASCESGPAVCDSLACKDGGLVPPSGTCDADTTQVYGTEGCPIGCVASSKC